MDTRQKIEIMQAYLDGKPVQYRIKDAYGNIECGWDGLDESNEAAKWQWDRYEYRLKPPADNKRGLYHKYNVYRADGREDPNAEYFVLRLDRNDVWGQSCRDAMLYLVSMPPIQSSYPQLAADIKEKYGKKGA